MRLTASQERRSSYLTMFPAQETEWTKPLVVFPLLFVSEAPSCLLVDEGKNDKFMIGMDNLLLQLM